MRRDGAVIDIAANAKLEKPVLIVALRARREPHFVATRNVVRVGDGAEATIVEASVALPKAAKDTQLNAATKIVVGKGAAVSHLKCTLEAGERGASVQLARRSRHRRRLPRLPLHGRQRRWPATRSASCSPARAASIDLSGAFLARGSEHVDTTLVVDHAVPQCTSRELFKGVLDGHARGVFQGKVIVRPDAQKTDGKQMAQVLMLSPDTEFDSKPELEIYADDVVCGHGSTSADLDEDLLFYCRARGIPEAQARAPADRIVYRRGAGQGRARGRCAKPWRNWRAAGCTSRRRRKATDGDRYPRELAEKREAARPAVPGGIAGAPYDVERIRSDFPILYREVYGKPLVYLDNAASAQKPRSVIEAMDHAYRFEYANVHRGLHYLSNTATQRFEDAREIGAPLPQRRQRR